MVPPLAFENIEGCQVKHEHEFVKHEHEFVKHEHEAILCGMNQGLRLPIRVPIWQFICYKDSYKKSWSNPLWNESSTKAAHKGGHLAA